MVRKIYISMVALTLSVAANAQNLLQNPDFEEEPVINAEVPQPASWKPEVYDGIVDNYVTVYDEDSHKGNKCAYIMVENTVPAQLSIAQNLDVTETGQDKSYTCSVWYKVMTIIDNFHLEIGAGLSKKTQEEMRDGGGVLSLKGKYLATPNNADDGEWRNITFDYDYPTNFANYPDYKYLQFFIRVVGGSVFIDDASVTVAGSTGIEGVSADGNRSLATKADGSTLYVADAEGTVSAYTADGRELGSRVCAAGQTVKFDNLPSGLVIVRAGSRSAKVLMK